MCLTWPMQAMQAMQAIDQGAELRFLAEIVWLPSAALSPYVEWEAIDVTSAKATMRHRGVPVSAVFYFDERGRFSRLTADRYTSRRKWPRACAGQRPAAVRHRATRTDLVRASILTSPGNTPPFEQP
jgi:Family of unknown function (DUF6544)